MKPRVKKEGVRYVKPMLGRSGTRVFTVEAITEGKVSFRTAIARSWEFPGFDKYNGR
jgi:hypothetical protein